MRIDKEDALSVELQGFLHALEHRVFRWYAKYEFLAKKEFTRPDSLSGYGAGKLSALRGILNSVGNLFYEFGFSDRNGIEGVWFRSGDYTNLQKNKKRHASRLKWKGLENRRLKPQ